MLADAINLAFARWELSHLHVFTLADGSRIGWVDPWGDLDHEDDTSVKLTRLDPGEAFAFTFDLGDSWDHICRVAEHKVDPQEVAGITPDRPIPIRGWGWIPDQHGRRFADDGWDDTPVPPAPDPPASDLPPLLYGWGPHEEQPREAAAAAAASLLALQPVRDWTREALKELRAAVYQRDDAAVVNLLSVFDAADVAHHAWPVLEALAADPGNLPSDRDILGWVTARLQERSFDGDMDLVEVLTGATTETLRPVAVDLEFLSMALEGASGADFDHALDARSGELTLVETSDELEELLADEHQIVLESADRNHGWWDMAEFIERIEDGELAERLDRAIRGKGAFRRFGDLIRNQDDEALLTRWNLFRDERQLGRARAWLARHGLRPAPRTG